MKERRKRIMKRLVMEELEQRTMLANTAMESSAITTGSVQDIYFSVVGNEGGGAAGIGMMDQPMPTAAAYVPQFGAINFGPANPLYPAETAFDAGSGLGQMTLTTGANTLGISSFANPTAGPSRAGGTGNPNLGQPEALAAEAVDDAILEYNAENDARIANRPGSDDPHADQDAAHGDRDPARKNAETERAKARSQAR